MKLRFEVDQAEAFRRGIDVPKSIVTNEVNPAELSQEQRDLIADRLVGIDVCQLSGVPNGILPVERNGQPRRIKTKLPTFESLMEAIMEDQRDYKSATEQERDDLESAKLKKQKAEALLDEAFGKRTA